MPVFRVCHTWGEDYVTIATSLEDAKELDDDTVARLTALEVLDEISGDLGDFEDALADDLCFAMQRLSDTAADLVRRHPDSFDSDTPAGKLWDTVNAFLSGKWEG